MRTSIVLVAFALLVAAACTYTETQGPPPQTAPPQQVVVAQPQPQPVIVAQPQPQPVILAQPQPQPVVVVQQPPQVIMPTTSNFGTIALNPGFMPDPHVVAGQSGGNTQASARAGNCRGWITNTPDHLFRASNHFGNLRIMTLSSEDTTLVVLRPDGTYMCNDDTYGRNPHIQGNFPAGTYAIWIGSYRSGVVAPYRLGFTELSSVRPANLGASTQVQQVGNVASNFGTVQLNPGFVPDPHVVRGVSGGAVSASSVSGNCRGWIAQTPDHIFHATGHFSSLRIFARSQADTTLVVIGPNGQAWCNDDASGRDPMVSGVFPAGTYRVWVGSYTQGQNATYNLGFSELSSQGPTTIALP